MDCQRIATRLSQIIKEAEGLKKLLDNGNTGRGFDLGLKCIELHAGAIRSEIDETRTLPAGVTAIGLDNPAELHHALKRIFGE